MDSGKYSIRMMNEISCHEAVTGKCLDLNIKMIEQKLDPLGSLSDHDKIINTLLLEHYITFISPSFIYCWALVSFFS